MMFCVQGNGNILKVRTDTNPCRIAKEWKCKNPERGKLVKSDLLNQPSGI